MATSTEDERRGGKKGVRRRRRRGGGGGGGGGGGEGAGILYINLCMYTCVLDMHSHVCIPGGEFVSKRQPLLLNQYLW